MDWRRELLQLERAYDSLLPNTPSSAYNNKPFGGSKNSGVRDDSNVIVGESVQFNFKKWSDQGIQQFPPAFTLTLPNALDIKYFQQVPDVSHACGSEDFSNELVFMQSYSISIYHRAVENRANCLDIGRTLLAGPVYLEEEEENDLDELTSSASKFEDDRMQLTG
jgi:hypothetical protein